MNQRQDDTAARSQVSCLSFILGFLYVNISDFLQEPTDVFNPFRLKLAMFEVEDLADQCKLGWGSKAAQKRLEKGVREFVQEELRLWDTLIEQDTDFHDRMDRVMMENSTPEDEDCFDYVLLAINILWFMEGMIHTRGLEDTHADKREITIDIDDMGVHFMRLMGKMGPMNNFFSQVVKVSRLMHVHEELIQACDAMVDQSVYSTRELYHEVLQNVLDFKKEMRENCEKHGFIDAVQESLLYAMGGYAKIQDSRMQKRSVDEYDGVVEDLDSGRFDHITDEELGEYIAEKAKTEREFYDLLLNIEFTMQYINTFWGLKEEHKKEVSQILNDVLNRDNTKETTKNQSNNLEDKPRRDLLS